MMTVHVTEAELARDVHAVLEKVRQGVEVVIEQHNRPVAVLRAAPQRRRLLEIAASLSAYSTAAIDPDFAADVQAFINNHREPLNPPEWD
jgi:antitoxin (DNA-binding transcriptional repressor) of toxin-antitoxin stability system